ncbi:MAG TPA: NAD(P)H-binding protein [Gemmatirosa sp.]
MSDPTSAPRARVFFVAGATGYVGRSTVGAAAATPGVRAVAHVRPDSPTLATWRTRFAALGDAALGVAVDATPWNEDAMAATLARLRPAAIFALLGTTRRRGASSGDTYESVDYGLTALLFRAAVRAARTTPADPPPRFVYLSALGANARSRTAYVAVRGRFEDELRAGPLPWTIVRPSFITGPDREESRPMERVGAAVVDALARPVGMLGARRVADRYRSITGSALAAALVRLADDPRAAGSVLESDALRG